MQEQELSRQLKTDSAQTLDKILNAESVAVVGASKTPTKRGYQAIKTLLDQGYEGAIFPVNPKEKRILGLQCFPSVSKIDGTVDLVLITTPAHTVPDILDDCGKKGVSGAVIIAGGFGEQGVKGKRLEEEMVAAAMKQGIRIIGPNTSGMMNLKTNLNLVGLKDAPKGDIALLCQSGNMALTIISEATFKSHKGFSYYVGVGNEADIRFHEYLDFFGKDPETKAILMYMEGMRDGRKFLQQAYKTTIDKPIILLKSGRTKTGKKSAGSHTGAIAGMSEVARTAFQRAGIIVIENSDELFPAAETLASLPVIKNKRVAILADGGGHATIAADLLTDLKLEIPKPNPKTMQKLREILPPAASVTNPVDVAGGTDTDPSIMADCARILMKDPSIGGVLIVGLFGGYGIRFDKSLSLMEEDAAHRMGKMVKKYKKPIILHSLYSSKKPHSLDLLRYYGIPVYDSLDISCKCMGVLSEYGSYIKSYHARVNFVLGGRQKAKSRGRKIITKAIQDGRRALLEYEAKDLFRLHGAPVPRDIIVHTADEAVRRAREVNGKVVLKIASPDILHKSDAGGVFLNLSSEVEITYAFNAIIENAKAYNPHAEIKGILISPMSDKGVEVIIGTKTDEQFGPVIMYGLGGVLVEILKDVSFRVLPISPRTAKKMIEEPLSYPILKGVRGQPPCDRKSLQKLLLTCSEIIEAYPEIQEMDLNPVILHEKGVSVVDARIILKEKEEIATLTLN